MTEKATTNNTLEQSEPHKRTGKHLLAFCFIGFGFYWAWLWVFAISTVPSALSTSLSIIDILPKTIASSGFAALALLAGALFARKLATPTGKRLLVVSAGVFGLASTALMSFYGGGEALDWITLLTSLLTGITRACFILLWGTFYSSISIKRALLYMSGSIALGAVLYLIITSLPPIEAVIITLLLPVAAVVTYILAARELEQEPAVSSKTSTFYPQRFWRLFLGIGIYAVAFGFLKDTLFTPNNEQVVIAFRIALIGVAITGLASAFIALRVKGVEKLVLPYRLILPITTVGFLLLALLGIEEGSIAIVFVMVGFTVFDILTWLVLANASARLSLSPFQVFGYGRFVHFTGLLVGGLIVYFTYGAESSNGGLFAPMSLIMVLMLIVASTLVLTENEFFGKSFFASDDHSKQDGLEAGAVSGDDEAGAANENGAAQVNGDAEAEADGTQYRARWRERCAYIAREYDLSPRESEVLTHLAKGRDTIFIQNELGISNHTVRSHVLHIYQKLDVHSRQELLDFIEQHDNR